MARRTRLLRMLAASRTGVSTTARLLTDYYLSRQTSIEGFDTDLREPFYGPCFPNDRSIDVSDIKGQISLFDGLLIDNETPKIVDVWHRSYEKFFGMINEIGFMEEAVRIATSNRSFSSMWTSDRALACGALALHTSWPDLGMIARSESREPHRLEPRRMKSWRGIQSSGKFVIGALDAPIAKCCSIPIFPSALYDRAAFRYVDRGSRRVEVMGVVHLHAVSKLRIARRARRLGLFAITGA